MVNDPRVTTLLSRLGGLYRDPVRVDRDASSLLKSSVGVHLNPGIAPLVENNGDSTHCLVFQGTIAIVFRGNTYQLLVDIYLPPGYPIRPPVSYVRLVPNMYLKENHPHVGSDGMVYMPYTHEWNPRTHSLIEMVVAMSSVFSADPPVFTRSTPPPPKPPPQLSTPVASVNTSSSHSHPPPPAYSDTGFISSNDRRIDSERYMQEQIEAIMAREAEEANLAAEVARRAAKEEEEKQQAQKVWEEQKKRQTKEQVNQKIHLHLVAEAEKTKASVQEDWHDQQYLKQSKQRIEEELEYYLKTITELEGHMATVDTKTIEIQRWLDDTKGSSSSSSKQDEDAKVDDLCQPVSKLHAQMLDLAAENAALTDALYFLDRAIYMGHMDCTTHLKEVRKLAKRQFLVRALLIKIDQVLLKKG